MATTDISNPILNSPYNSPEFYFEIPSAQRRLPAGAHAVQTLLARRAAYNRAAAKRESPLHQVDGRRFSTS